MVFSFFGLLRHYTNSYDGLCFLYIGSRGVLMDNIVNERGVDVKLHKH